jgi:hypothetical protein
LPAGAVAGPRAQICRGVTSAAVDPGRVVAHKGPLDAALCAISDGSLTDRSQAVAPLLAERLGVGLADPRKRSSRGLSLLAGALRSPASHFSAATEATKATDLTDFPAHLRNSAVLIRVSAPGLRPEPPAGGLDLAAHTKRTHDRIDRTDDLPTDLSALSIPSLARQSRRWPRVGNLRRPGIQPQRPPL